MHASGGYGPWDGAGRGCFPTWRVFLAGHALRADEMFGKAMRALGRDPGVERARCAAACARILHLAERCLEERALLLTAPGRYQVSDTKAEQFTRDFPAEFALVSEGEAEKESGADAETKTVEATCQGHEIRQEGRLRFICNLQYESYSLRPSWLR